MKPPVTPMDHENPGIVWLVSLSFVLGACVWGGFFWSVLNWLEML